MQQWKPSGFSLFERAIPWGCFCINTMSSEELTRSFDPAPPVFAVRLWVNFIETCA
jgi:hypothetical protein